MARVQFAGAKGVTFDNPQREVVIDFAILMMERVAKGSRKRQDRRFEELKRRACALFPKAVRTGLR